MGDNALTALRLKRKYDSDDSSDDPMRTVDTFLVPCLSLSVSYSRITGFFSASSLSIASQGIAELIRNDGVMRIVTSPRLSKEDTDAIMAGEDETSIIANSLIEEITPEFIENESLEAMGWMIAHNRLEIRVVVLTDSNGRVLPFDNVAGMFHSKVGIFEDSEGNMVSFTGSINESANGWSRNIESFVVFCSWLSEDQLNYTQDNKAEFEKYWNLGHHNRSKTISFPDAVRNEWIQHSIPDSKEDLKVFCCGESRGSDGSDDMLRIRGYQQEAIENWFSNSNWGIFSMATGTGKTITALLALKRVLSIEKKALVVIVVPFQHLIKEPWEETLRMVIPDGVRKLNIVHAFNSSSVWIKAAERFVLDFELGLIDNIVYLTTYDTFSRDRFGNHISSIKLRPNAGKRILIADEVHYAGSDEYRNGLLDIYDYRLGLSATPSRYLDDEGTNHIIAYFDKVVYNFPLQRAINDINPDTGESFLAPYYYTPIFVTLNRDEMELYNDYSRKISKFSDSSKLTPAEIKLRDMLMIQRSRILKNACSKLETLRSNLAMYKDERLLDHCIIYCSDGRVEESEIRSVEGVVMALNDLGIRCHRFTAEEDFKERSRILEGFDSGEFKVLVAIKCLDEGVDVPSTRNAFILASTGNPKEYIQRRGRVLRRCKGKEFARIYDFVVVPNEPFLDPVSEVQIFENESKRFIEFAKYSLNKDENYSTISDYYSKYGLVFKDEE